MTDFPNGLPDDAIRPIPRPSDGESHYLVMTGGLRAARLDANQWLIEPLPSEGEAVATGVFSDAQLNAFVRLSGLTYLGFHNIHWSRGENHSSWSPYVYGEANHSRGPSQLWSSIASNLLGQRMDEREFNERRPSIEEISAFKDDRTPEEHLSLQISSSLRNLDISIEQIADFYTERLTNEIYGDLNVGQRKSQSDDQRLYAHIHAFLLQIGSARDYLAALIAHRIGLNPRNVDSLEKLRRSLRGETRLGDELLQCFIRSDLLVAPTPEAPEWKTAGWLSDMSNLRNEFVHRRAYGSKFEESMGWVEERAEPLGVFRYLRPIVLKNGEVPDALDVLGFYYCHFQKLLMDCAKASGLDTKMLTLTDADFIKID